jgi:uncharacterized repeat protein (TIGR01451 family)
MVTRPPVPLLLLIPPLLGCPPAADDDSAALPDPTPADDDTTPQDPCDPPPQQGGDLQVQEIRRVPNFPALPFTTDPAGYNASIDPAVASLPTWPSPGETVTFTAAVTNQGPAYAAGYRWRWLIDGVPSGSGLTRDIDPGVVVEHDKEWTWEDGEHEVEFILTGLTCDAVGDPFAGNDRLSLRTDAWLFTFYLWPDALSWFADHDNFTGSRSASDWLRANVLALEDVLDSSVSDLNPMGVRPRLAVDRFVLVPQGTPDPGGDHVPEPCPTDLCWGLRSDDDWLGAAADAVDARLLSPWVQKLGVLAPSAWDVSGAAVLVPGASDLLADTWGRVHVRSVADDLLSESGLELDPYHAWGLDQEADWDGRGLPRRRGPPGSYLNQIPSTAEFVILQGGNPAAGATVEVFQRIAGTITEPAKFTGATDAEGRYPLPTMSTSEWGLAHGAGGGILLATPFSTAWSDDPRIDGDDGVLLVHVTYADAAEAWHFLDLPAFHLAAAAGEELATFTLGDLN